MYFSDIIMVILAIFLKSCKNKFGEESLFILWHDALRDWPWVNPIKESLSEKYLILSFFILRRIMYVNKNNIEI